jgi:hypothetical protein
MKFGYRPLTGAALLVALLGAAACSEDGAATLPTEGTGESSASARPAGEDAALDELTRAVALALRDQGLRQRVKNDMRESRHTVEHKLELTSYLKGANGGILLAKMAQATGRSPEALLALVGQVRPLEFYMPVREQRESWTGGTNLLVGSLLEDHDTPTVFTLRGEPVSVAADATPPLPTLALVPVETDFARSLEAARFENRDDQGGQAIGTYAPVSGLRAGGARASAVPADRPSGLYMTRVYIPHDYEGAFKGNPEFETHLQAPKDDPTTAADIRCAGESAPDPFSVYNQDGTGYTGAVLVASEAEMNAFRSQYGSEVGMSIISWEDDDTRCTIKVEQSRFQNMLKAVVAVFPATHAAMKDTTAAGPIEAWPAVRTAAVAVASWLQSNDELVGTRVNTPCSYPDGTQGNWKIIDGDSSGATRQTGCSTLEAHTQGM